MARIKFGMMMTDARGKLGGQVFTKTRSGATVRTKVTPRNPQTLAQGQARSILANLSRGWSNLSVNDRESWQSAVNSFTKTDVFGDNYAPSGKNLYVSLNANLQNIGKSTIDSAPSETALPSIAFSGVSFNLPDGVRLGNVLFSADVVDIPTGTSLVIEASRPANAGRYNFSGGFAKVIVLDDASDLDGKKEDIFDAYIAKYGSPAVGKKVAFRVKLVSISTGQASPYQTMTTIVV